MCFASQIQKVAALSSGEAELNSHVVGLSEGLGVATLCEEWRTPRGVESLSHSFAARGIASRAGSGKLDHLLVKHLWTQDLVNNRRATIGRVPWLLNSADALTHPCTEATLAEHLARVGIVVILTARAQGGARRAHVCTTRHGACLCAMMLLHG